MQLNPALYTTMVFISSKAFRNLWNFTAAIYEVLSLPWDLSYTQFIPLLFITIIQPIPTV